MNKLYAIFYTSLVGVYLCSVPTTAWGYIDPGAGSVALQVILASFFGVILFAKNFWKRIRALFFKEKK